MAVSPVTDEVEGEEVVTRRLQKSRPIADFLAAEAKYGDGWAEAGSGGGDDGGDDDPRP